MNRNFIVFSCLISGLVSQLALAETAPLHVQRVVITKQVSGFSYELQYQSRHKFEKGVPLKIAVSDPALQTVGRVRLVNVRTGKAAQPAPPVVQSEGEGMNQTRAWLFRLQEENLLDEFDVQISIKAAAPAMPTTEAPLFSIVYLATLDASPERETLVREIALTNATIAGWGHEKEPVELVLQDDGGAGVTSVLARMEIEPLAQGAQRLLTDHLNVYVDSRTANIALTSDTASGVRPLPRLLYLGNGELSDQLLLRVPLPSGPIALHGSPLASPRGLLTTVQLTKTLQVGTTNSSVCSVCGPTTCGPSAHRALLPIGFDDDLSLTVSRAKTASVWLPIAIDDKYIKYVVATPHNVCVFNQGVKSRKIEFKGTKDGEGVFSPAQSYTLGAYAKLSLVGSDAVQVYACSGSVASIDRMLPMGEPGVDTAKKISTLAANLKALQGQTERLLPILQLDKDVAKRVQEASSVETYIQAMRLQLESLIEPAAAVEQASADLGRLIAADNAIAKFRDQLETKETQDQFWREYLRIELKRKDLAKDIRTASMKFDRATATFAWQLAGGPAKSPEITFASSQQGAHLEQASSSR